MRTIKELIETCWDMYLCAMCGLLTVAAVIGTVAFIVYIISRIFP